MLHCPVSDCPFSTHQPCEVFHHLVIVHGESHARAFLMVEEIVQSYTRFLFRELATVRLLAL